MKATLEFLGGAGTVTGSRSLFDYHHSPYLIDCGLFQGPKDVRMKNWDSFPVDPNLIKGVFLTHAHLDHSGYLPRFVASGYRGPVHCSKGTADLLRVMLLDSAKIQEEDAAFANKTKHSRHQPASPLYTIEDAKQAIDLIKVWKEDEWMELETGLSMKAFRAGHIVGARSLVFSFQTPGGRERLCFSGDLGHDRMKTLRGPMGPSEAEHLVLESTYGGRNHEKVDPMELFADVINRTADRGGVLVIPAFAVGRAQELLYMIRLLEDKGVIERNPVILDSPMSSKATSIFLKHTEDHKLGTDFDVKNEENFLPSGFEVAERPDDSMVACMRDGPMIVVSAAGMLSGGRILHHLKRRLPHEKNTVLFVGYQAEGTKGRYLQDIGAKAGSMRIHHEEVEVCAEVATLPALSAHGDSEDMLKWLSDFREEPKNIFLNHGTIEAAGVWAHTLKNRLGWKNVKVVREGQSFDLAKL